MLSQNSVHEGRWNWVNPTRADCQCLLKSLTKFEISPIQLRKAVKLVVGQEAVSPLLVKGCSSSVGPPVLKSNNFPDLPSVDDKLERWDWGKALLTLRHSLNAYTSLN